MDETAKKIPLSERAEDWTNLFDRRGIERTWIGADGIYTVALDGNDSYGSAIESTKTFFIFSDSIMGSSDENCVVYYAPGQPSQTAAILEGATPEKDKMTFRWGIGGNGEFGPEQHLFGEHKWMLDCFQLNSSIYIFGFPQIGWKPQQTDMVELPIVNGEVDFAHYKTTYDIKELLYKDGTYSYNFGSAIVNNTEYAHMENADGYIYIYGYRDALKEFSRKDMILARIKAEDFPNFSKTEYFNGEAWTDNMLDCAVLMRDVSTEFSISIITEGKYKGKYILVYTEATESPKVMYSISDSLTGPFSNPVEFYCCPEHGQRDGGMYTYNAKAHPHLSRDGKLLVSYNCNNRLTFGFQASDDCFPRFVWLNFNAME